MRAQKTGTPAASIFVLYGVVAALTTVLLVFSQTVAYSADEGFHLVAAQLINAGRLPYVDFFYQHPPLYPWLNAAWLRAFGESWRSAHALSALLTGGCVFLVADFVFRRLSHPDWRLAGGIAAAALVGLHSLVLQFGTIAQPYGLALFLSFLSFRLTITTVERERAFRSFWAGLCAGGAVAASPLSAPLAPILLIWIVRRNRAGDRWKKCTGWLAGAAIPFLPLLWLAARAPHQVAFDIFEYHLFYRGLGYPRTWNLRVYGQWMDSAQILLPLLLSGLGLLFAAQERAWTEAQRSELGLCAWLTAGFGVWLLFVRPAFPQYFVLLVPFLAVLAAVGVQAVAARFGPPEHALWPAIAVVALFALPLGKWAWESPGDFQSRWKHYEDIARVVDRVTPPGAPIFFAEDCVYFAARRLPPPGLENPDFRLPPDLAASVHMLPASALEAAVAAGRFATVGLERDDAWVQSWQLASRYARRQTVQDYEIFWDRITVPRETTHAP